MSITFKQLSEIFEIFKTRKLSPYHPLINHFVRYEDTLNEIAETQDDLDYAKEKDDMEEEIEELEKIIKELESQRLSQWRAMMESFVINTHYEPYVGE